MCNMDDTVGESTVQIEKAQTPYPHVGPNVYSPRDQYASLPFGVWSLYLKSKDAKNLFAYRRTRELQHGDGKHCSDPCSGC